MRITKTIQLGELAYELEHLPQRITANIDKVLHLPSVLAQAKSLCPVQSGALRDSIRVTRPTPSLTQLKAGGVNYLNPVTGNPVNYARHVHDGTRHHPPNPFLLQALLSQRDQLTKELLEAPL